MDLSFPVDISIPVHTPAPATPEIVGRPFDDLLEDGLAQALAAAPGITTLAPTAMPSVDGPSPESTTASVAPTPGVAGLTAVSSDLLTENPLPLTTATTADVAADDATVTGPAGTAGPSGAAGTAGTDATTPPSSTSTTGPGDTSRLAEGTDAPGTATSDRTTPGPVALAATTASAARAQDTTTATTSDTETGGPTATTNQALALGAVGSRTLDPARVALTRQTTRVAEQPTDPDADPTDTITEATGARTDGSATATGDAADVRTAVDPAAPHTDAAALGADTSQRSGTDHTRPGTGDVAPLSSDTLATVATDKVRYLRDLAPAREIQRLAIDLDDARVAVRFADGAATVDVMSDPSSRLDSGWVSNVEKTLRQLDRPVEPMTPGDQSQSGERRDRQDPDSRRQDTPQHHDQPQPSIDDERVRRWQDATRALMTTPNTRN